MPRIFGFHIMQLAHRVPGLQENRGGIPDFVDGGMDPGEDVTDAGSVSK